MIDLNTLKKNIPVNFIGATISTNVILNNSALVFSNIISICNNNTKNNHLHSYNHFNYSK
jgi:hypothetical protein